MNKNYFQAFKGAIARIYHANGAVVGMGFLVSDRYLLTCAHVVAAALGIAENTQEQPTGTIELDFPLIARGQKVKSKVVFWQPVNSSLSVEDIAGLELEVEDSLPKIQPVYLVDAEDYWQHPIRILGFPKGYDMGIWATGTLRDRTAYNWVQIDAVATQDRPVEQGFSGAPIWDESLQGVVGMAVAAEKRRADVTAAFMIPTSILRGAWLDLDRSPAQHPAGVRQSLDGSPSSSQQKLLKPLKDYQSLLFAKREAAYNQLSSTLNATDILTINQQIKGLEIEINESQKKIDHLSK